MKQKKPTNLLTANTCKVTAEFQQVSSLQNLSNSQELWKSEKNVILEVISCKSCKFPPLSSYFPSQNQTQS